MEDDEGDEGCFTADQRRWTTITDFVELWFNQRLPDSQRFGEKNICAAVATFTCSC